MVEDLHKLGIVHCDIKPDNILTSRVPNRRRIDGDIDLNLMELYFIDYGIS
jgi:serine/threonine protein kinase